jgi:hypothetical protein
MDYPRYRREGLPLNSAHMESLVKEIGYRVKGTEKFWNDGQSAESFSKSEPPPSAMTIAWSSIYATDREIPFTEM